MCEAVPVNLDFTWECYEACFHCPECNAEIILTEPGAHDTCCGTVYKLFGNVKAWDVED
jgi:hypothetical protein